MNAGGPVTRGSMQASHKAVQTCNCSWEAQAKSKPVLVGKVLCRGCCAEGAKQRVESLVTCAVTRLNSLKLFESCWTYLFAPPA